MIGRRMLGMVTAWVFLGVVSTTGHTAPTALVSQTTFGGHTYALTDIGSSWAEAEAFAITQGGHLVTIDDTAENAFLFSHFVQGVAKEDYWIGLNCIGCSSYLDSAAWTWASGTTPTYLNFRLGQPDFGSGDDRYAVINYAGTGSQWDNYPNTGFRTPRAIVELTAAPIPEPASYVMMIAGLGVLGFAVRRQHRA